MTADISIGDTVYEYVKDPEDPKNHVAVKLTVERTVKTRFTTNDGRTWKNGIADYSMFHQLGSSFRGPYVTREPLQYVVMTPEEIKAKRDELSAKRSAEILTKRLTALQKFISNDGKFNVEVMVNALSRELKNSSLTWELRELAKLAKDRGLLTDEDYVSALEYALGDITGELSSARDRMKSVGEQLVRYGEGRW